MMYFGTRIRPVADVVAEAMEAEDASVVNNYVMYLLAHACDTRDAQLRRQCDEIRRAHGWRPFTGAPASQNNLSQPVAEKTEAVALPAELCSPEAQAVWQCLREEGFIIAGGYALARGVSNNQATYIASALAERFEIKDKWKVFQSLWNIRNMAQLAGAWQQTGKLPPRHAKIDQICEIRKKRTS